MKAKNLVGALFMAAFGAFVALFAYTRLEGRKVENVGNNSLSSGIAEARPVLTSMQQSTAGQVDLTYAAEQTVHAVVHVRTSTIYSGKSSNPIMEWFYGDSYRDTPREVKGYGSGVIISSDGYIITNNHVIENAEKITVKLNDNREFVAEIVGRDQGTDIALLKVKGENLPFIKYGDSDVLKLGEWVLAVGNPFNLTSTVTAGIVSAKGRNLGISDDNYHIESFIQTDAALNVGNSGGALVNTSGQLVGITAAIVSPSGAYAGNSFAIPVNIVKKVVEDLKQYGAVQRAIIGVTISEVTPEIADKENLKEIRGAYVTGVTSKGAASESGLKEKDVITKVNNMPVASVTELQEQVGKFRPGDQTNITYIRSGKENTVPITMKSIGNSTDVVKPGIAFGAKLEPISLNERNKFKIDYGVKITEINEGRLNDLGMKKGYIILGINGKKVRSASEISDLTDGEQNLESIEGFQSNGTYFSYQFKR
jgi:Do/DeqQ family serine protease